MATSEFDVELFERRLHTLKDSQESIQGLSAWCLERRQHHKKIVATWLQVLKKVKVEHRLTLFYLANDVIQYSKRKNFEFVESWGTTLQRATTMVRDEKVKHRILRIFKIWDQRQVYDEEFLADLSGLISAAPKKKLDPQPASAPEEFQAALLISTMRSCATLEQATDARLRDLRESNIDIENAEELCASLKDRRRVEDAEKEVDLAVRNVENYVRALEAEIRERTQVLELLEQADQFYETQRGEVKIVTNAYRNFGSRVKNLKKKLDELLPTLVSPLPSPDINAPSPSPDSDIELPGDENQSMNQIGIVDVAPPSIYGSYSHDYDPVPVPAPDMSQTSEATDFTSNFSSFMGGNVDFGNMRNLFNERSSTPTGMSQQYNDSLEAKPIEVINMRPSKNDSSGADFNISSFLKTVLPSSESGPETGGIPGLGLDIPDSQVESPQRPNYRHSPAVAQHPVTPVISRMIANQATPMTGLNNCQISHSTPLSVRNLSSESHTPSPYSSQNSQSNITVPFDTATNNNTVNPLPPPPLPPPIFLDDENCYNKLPPKFPTWTPPSETIKEPAKWEEKGKNSMNPTWPGECNEKSKTWIDGDTERWDSNNDSAWPNAIRGKTEILSETPESPPMYEKAGFTDPVEYDDSQPRESLLGTAADVDHRVIPVPMTTENPLPYRLMKAADVDHRNLISLTGSPANHNINDTSINSLSNNNSLWPASDQDYRQHMQPGDIVESVDMEMSDDETDSKPKGRVLVDVRSQDRDMRMGPQPGGPQHIDMDMRMIPLPGGQLPAPPHGPMMQDVRMMHSGPPPPPPPPPQFHQGQGFRQEQPEFRHNPSAEFHGPQPNFHPNRAPPGFIQNQQEFRSGQQEFHQLHQSQPEFHQSQQDFEYRDGQHNMHNVSQEFIGEQQQQQQQQPRGRYPPSADHPHRDGNFPSHRNDRGGPLRGGRGFPRLRRDRYSDDHMMKQRNMMMNNQRKPRPMDQHQRMSPEILPNSRPLLLQPPDTVVILDEEGMPIGVPPDTPTNTQQDRAQTSEHEGNSQGSMAPDRRLSHDAQNSRDSDHNPQSAYATGSNLIHEREREQKAAPTESEDSQRSQSQPQQQQQQQPQPQPQPQLGQVTVIPITDTQEVQDAQYVPISDYEEHVESESVHPEKCTDSNESSSGPQAQQEAGLSADSTVKHTAAEQTEHAANTTPTTSNNELKRPSTNGNFEDQAQNEVGPAAKRIALSNGPQTPTEPEPGHPNGPVLAGPPLEVHPNPGYEFDGGPPAGPNFRPRLGAPVPFPPWRGGPPRGRGFRGGPRGPWMDHGARGPRGPAVGNFMLRGLKRGGQFRGNGFRGRGRGNNW